MRDRPLARSALLAAIAWASPILAQVSDADREAARNLYKEGDALQQAGKYQDALDRFSRSNAVFQAPTTMLHIGECFAALGKLVEAAETYRALSRMTLPPGAPAPFVAAQAEGAAELRQVEPRIPHVVLDVAPHPSNLTVTIDGQPMNAALLGVDRPVDPGAHAFVAEAPGYARAEQAALFNERDPPKRVTIQLQPAGAVAMPMPLYAPPPQYVAVGPASTYRPIERGRVSNSGLFFGIRVGGLVPEGDSNITNGIGPGLSLGAEIDFRFARRLYIGAVVNHAFLSEPSAVSSEGLNETLSTTSGGAVFGVVINPDRFSALFQLGGGYRVVSTSGGTLALDSATIAVPSSSLSSPEFMFGTGLWIPIGRHVRLVPRADFGFGSLSGSGSASSSSSGSSTSSSDTYVFMNFNLAGYWNVDFR